MNIKNFLTMTLVLISSWNTIAEQNSICDNPDVKREVFAQAYNRIKQKPYPSVKSLLSYNERSSSTDSCCVDFNAEPHPEKPNCFEAYRTFCYNMETGVLRDWHDYNGWCDY